MWGPKASTKKRDSRPWCSEDSSERCKKVGIAVNGDVGTMVETIQELILQYYEDVGSQANEAFNSARQIALLGFIIFALSIGYVVSMDLVSRFKTNWQPKVLEQGTTLAETGMSVGSLGLVAGGIVEVLAGVQFVLYGKTTKQFAAFHICLERTHRYLLAYKIAEKIGTAKDETLQKIVCIMANAPMITQQDMDSVGSGRPVPNHTTTVTEALDRAGAASSEVPLR
jgi:hypothetical protein